MAAAAADGMDCRRGAASAGAHVAAAAHPTHPVRKSRRVTGNEMEEFDEDFLRGMNLSFLPKFTFGAEFVGIRS